MPAKKYNDGISKLSATIQVYSRVNNITCDKIAKAAGMTVPTLYRRYRNPWEFRLREIQSISRLLKIDIDEMIPCLFDYKF